MEAVRGQKCSKERTLWHFNSIFGSSQGYRDRYDIIDHGHEKNTFMCFFHRPIFTKIREFATSVLWKLVVHFGYRGCNCTGVDIIS